MRPRSVFVIFHIDEVAWILFRNFDQSTIHVLDGPDEPDLP